MDDGQIIEGNLKKVERYSKEWDNLVINLAYDFLIIRACRNCGAPVNKGYCCTNCGSDEP